MSSDFYDEEPFKKVQRQVNAQDAINTTAPSKPRQIGEDSDEFADPAGDIPEELGGESVTDKKLPFDFVFMFTGSEADIAAIPEEYGTFALCDGAANSVGNGGSGANLSGRFIVGIGEQSGSGINKPTYAVGDEGGFTWHGMSENNHPAHDLSHLITITPQPSIEVTPDTATDVWAYDGNGAPPDVCVNFSWTGSDDAPTGPTDEGSYPPDGNLLHHKGYQNSLDDTDNRPPFYALCFIERIA